MSFSDIYARAVAMVGGTMILMRRWGSEPQVPAWGGAPDIPEAVPQRIPTLKMPTARGWRDGRRPEAAPGLEVNAFATDLAHPRWICVLPNGDVTVAESLGLQRRKIETPFQYAITATMRRAKAIGESANRITLLRDADGDGVAEIRHAFLENLYHPFGMAMLDGTFYVGNTDGLVAFPYADGATRIGAEGRTLARRAATGPAASWPTRTAAGSMSASAR